MAMDLVGATVAEMFPISAAGVGYQASTFPVPGD